MRKTFALMAALIVSAAAIAQGSVKVSAKFAKGDYAVYSATSNSTHSAQGASEASVFTGEVRYDVVDASADGYTVAIETLRWDKEGDTGDDPMVKVTKLQAMMLEGIRIVVKTDADGKILRIENLDEVKGRLDTFMDDLASTLFKDGDTAGPLKKDTFKETLQKEMTEEKMLEGIRTSAAGQFALYGKTLSTGTMESEESGGVKFTTTYVVTPPKNGGGYTVKSSSVSNMSEDDVADMVVKQMEQLMPDQVEMVKQNIGMMKGTGMLQMDATKQVTLEFLPSGWLQSGDTQSKVGIMGSESQTQTKWSVKECSWK